MIYIDRVLMTQFPLQPPLFLSVFFTCLANQPIIIGSYMRFYHLHSIIEDFDGPVPVP